VTAPTGLSRRVLDVFGLIAGREQVRRGETAVRAPFLGDCEHLVLTGQVVKVIGTTHRFPQGEISGQHDILPAQGYEQRALRGPRTDPWYRDQLRDELVVGQCALSFHGNATVREAFGEITKRADLAPRKTR